MKIILAGGTGFIGKSLLEALLREDHRVVLLTRTPGHPENSDPDRVATVTWDAKRAGAWAKEVDGAGAVINLTGESIAAKRWSRAQKERIVQSRVGSVAALAQAIERARSKPAVFINASAVGYYGNVDHEAAGEERPKGEGFLADTCQQWEAETVGVAKFGIRVVLLRLGVVLEQGGGAMAKIVPPFRFFLGGPLGSGKQWFPWVHRDDVVGAVLFALEHPELAGPVNVTAPEMVNMKDFCGTLGRVMNRPSWAPVPAFMLKLMLGEMSDMLLTGQRAVPEKLKRAAYPFKHPQLREALESILNAGTSK
ncbi:MAG: TIGR01777 family oxidoreductase [Candidatus Omnitrophota bacterium]|nr:TIGR01777 family oxidoreductase [Candidatus Omnitrophota bacterium]